MKQMPLRTELFTAEEIGDLWVGRHSELVTLEENFRRADAHPVVITGQRGTGKTALAYKFREHADRIGLFLGGWNYIQTPPFSNLPFKYLSDNLKPIINNEKTLLFIDDYNNGADEFKSFLRSYIGKNPSQNLILSTSGSIPTFLHDPLVIELGGLSQSEFFELVRRRFNLSGADEAQAQKLFELVAGSPLYAEIAGKTIRENLLTLNEFLQGLHPFTRSGLLGPDGQPIEKVPDAVRLAVVDTNQLILNKIRNNPQILQSLAPRKFEEIVSDLLAERGYQITLTPPSKDGGFDMFAARRDDLGSFLFLVECKRYTPPNKVGVSIVRALHGVVQKQQANAGIVITSSFFTKGAKEFQEDVPHQMHLRDFLALQKWLGII